VLGRELAFAGWKMLTAVENKKRRSSEKRVSGVDDGERELGELVGGRRKVEEARREYEGVASARFTRKARRNKRARVNSSLLPSLPLNSFLFALLFALIGSFPKLMT